MGEGGLIYVPHPNFRLIIIIIRVSTRGSNRSKYDFLKRETFGGPFIKKVSFRASKKGNAQLFRPTRGLIFVPHP